MKSRIDNIFEKSKKTNGKKILIPLLLLLFSLSVLISCNSISQNNEIVEDGSSSQTISEAIATPIDPDLVVSEDASEKYNDTEIYGTIEDKKQEYYENDADKVTYYYEVERFYLNDDYPAVINNTLQQIYDEHEKMYKEGSSNYSAGKVQEIIGEEEPTSYDFFHFLEIEHIGDEYISILYNNVSYMGGAHPYSQYEGITINRKTGKLVTASELLRESDDEILKEVCETMGMEEIGTWDDIDFYITDSNIVFFYRMPNYWNDVVWTRN